IPDVNCGLNRFYQLGCDCTYAYANIETMTGTTVQGKKGHAMKIQWSGPSLFIYEVEGGPEILS
ncbi:MAG TPA: hypothetical protein PL045_08235, partial [Chitinophagaceae bacterium]|nr:hypothetical protein [Chitinophagaceae bacterium]